MYNPHSMYLLGKSIQADRLKAAEQQRLANRARSMRADEPTGDSSLSLRSGRRLGLSLAARTAIVIALAVVLNIAG